MSDNFIEGWTLYQTLGEGSFGEVRLAVHNETRKQIAVKFMQDSEENKLSVEREIKIHQALDHPHIVHLYGTRYLELHDVKYRCIFLEYLRGGELFDKITPGKGLLDLDSFLYFQQLLEAVEYLHLRGITHRDIKPENLLIDEFNQLKIIDFGLATVFKKRGRERMMENYCGTPQYMSPEVCARVPHHAQPAEVFSLGVVLVAMWTGTLPWFEPNIKCKEYSQWWSTRMDRKPWNQLSECQLDLAKKILKHEPSKRLTLPEIRKQQWYVECERLTVPEKTEIWSSQPLLQSERLEMANHARKVLSQPADIQQILLEASVSPPNNSSSSSPKNRYEDLVARMTRFWVNKSNEDIIKILEHTCGVLGFTSTKISNMELSITAKDTQSRALQLHATIYRKESNGSCEDERALIDFRLSKGDGLDFKSAFSKFEKKMHRYRIE